MSLYTSIPIHATTIKWPTLYDDCCGKIYLFRVQNRVALILSWWKCCQVYQTGGLFHQRWSDFLLFWYQISYITYDECCGKIDLFQCSKQGCTYPTMLGMLSGILTRGVISWKMPEFLVILIPNICTSNRTNFIHYWRPKICQFFNPWTGQFSRDTRQ